MLQKEKSQSLIADELVALLHRNNLRQVLKGVQVVYLRRVTHLLYTYHLPQKAEEVHRSLQI